MKYKYFLLKHLLLLFLIQFNAIGKLQLLNEFQLERLTSNFNGSVLYQNVILVYGSGGIILRSLDEGKNWKQINLNDSLNITKIIVYEDIFYGISIENFIIKSTDKGLNWEVVRLSEPAKLFNIFAYNGNLYVIGNEAIFVLSLELDALDKLPIITNSDTLKLSLSNSLVLDNKIVFLIDNNKIKVVPFDALQNINSNDNIYEICNWCKSFGSVFSNGKNLIFFTYTDSLFSYNLNTLQKDFFGANYNFRNSVFFVKDSTIYFAFNKLGKPRTGFTLVKQEYDKLFFGKVDIYNKQIVVFGEDTSNPFISRLNLNSINFSGNGKILLVGNNKLIYLSEDFGTNWRIVSYMSGRFSIVHFFNPQRITIYENYGIFINSSDGGVTWQPSSKYPEKFFSNDFTNLPSQVVFTGQDDGLIYFFILSTKLGQPQIIYSQDYGNTFSRLDLPFQSISYLFARVFNTYIHYHRISFFPPRFYHLLFEKDTVRIIKQIESDPNVVFNALYSSKDTLYGLVTHLNSQKTDSLNNNKKGNDSLFVYVSPDTAVTWKLLMGLKIAEPGFSSNLVATYFFDSLIFVVYDYLQQIGSSIDSNTYKGKEKVNIFLINLHSKTYSKIYELFIPDSILFSGAHFWKIGNYLVLSLFLSTITSTPYGIFGTNQSDIYFTKQDYIPEISKWGKFYDERYINPIFDLHRLSPFSYPNGFYSDTLFPLLLFDTLHNEAVLFKAKLKKDSYLTKDTILTDRFPFYISQPIPNPSKGKTKFSLYFDPKYYIEDFKFYLFDLAGKQVNLLNGLSINQSTPYSGEVILDTQGLSVGLYLFVAKLGNTVNSVPLIVE
jgi:hypothetical protein